MFLSKIFKMTTNFELGILKYISHKTFSKRFLARSLIHKRHLCSKRDDTQDKTGKVQDHDSEYVPSRIRKRLREKGLTIDNVEKTHILATRDKATNPIADTLDSVVDTPHVEFPSDIDKLRQHRSQEQYSHRPKGIAPDTTSVLLFPGQGSQFVGMGKQLLRYPGVEEMYSKASSILGYDLLNVCINGPENKLMNTLYCQPAVVVTSLAAMEKLQEEHQQALDHVVATAGFSVGEFSALVACGAMSFEDAVQIVKLRAIAMNAASENTPGGMLSVVLDHKSQLRTAMTAAREYCRTKLGIEEPVCTVANFLCTNVKAVAGNEEALVFLEQYGREWGIRRTKRLPVSGAFHTELMKTGRTKFWNFFDAVEKAEINKPKIPIYLNIDGKQFSTNDERWRNYLTQILTKQLHRPVKWEQMMHIVYTRPADTPFPKTYEIGPGRQLGTLLKNTNILAYHSYSNVEV